jgi:hypothetical protein
MQKVTPVPARRMWLRGSRRPVVGEEMVTFCLPSGHIVFADCVLENELFVMNGDRIRVLNRGTRYIESGRSMCVPQNIWYIRYASGLTRFSDLECLLDAFDGSWRRTTIRCDALVPELRCVYEG